MDLDLHAYEEMEEFKSVYVYVVYITLTLSFFIIFSFQ